MREIQVVRKVSDDNCYECSYHYASNYDFCNMFRKFISCGKPLFECIEATITSEETGKEESWLQKTIRN